MTGGIRSLAGLKARMAFLGARQAVVAGNVAHADTPGYRPRDIVPPGADRAALPLAGTAAGHLAAGAGGGQRTRAASAFETRPSGNAVSLEDEMLKLAEIQIEHQMAAGLYQRSLAALKTAIGRRA